MDPKCNGLGLFSAFTGSEGKKSKAGDPKTAYFNPFFLNLLFF